MAGISGLAVTSSGMFLTDPILGQVFKFNNTKYSNAIMQEPLYLWRKVQMTLAKWKVLSLPIEGLHPYAGVRIEEALKDSEVVRRKAAKSSIRGMKSFKNVVFGFPQSIIEGAHGKLFVSDLYRHGIWELDPKKETVKPVLGFKTTASYHFGAVNGNLGMPGRFARVYSPAILHYDKEREVYLIPSMYGSTIILANKDFSKTCEVDLGQKLKAIFHAIFLSTGELAVVDSSSHNVYIYEKPDLSCLTPLNIPGLDLQDYI